MMDSLHCPLGFDFVEESLIRRKLDRHFLTGVVQPSYYNIILIFDYGSKEPSYQELAKIL